MVGHELVRAHVLVAEELAPRRLGDGVGVVLRLLDAAARHHVVGDVAPVHARQQGMRECAKVCTSSRGWLATSHL